MIKNCFVESIQKLSEALETCIGRKQFYAEESARLNNSVKTLQEWGDEVIKQSVVKTK